MVIMSMETYERIMTKSDIHEKLAVAERQVEIEELPDGEAVFARLEKKHGS